MSKVKFVIGKEIHDELMEKYGDIFLFKKSGKGIGTISGDYIKVKDNPAVWEYKTKENVLKYANENQRRIYFANISHYVDSSIKQIPNVTKKNYLSIATNEFNKMDNMVSNTNKPIICKTLNKPIVKISRHILNPKKHTIKQMVERTSILPFVMPIIQKYGIFAGNRKDSKGTMYTELIARARITNNGNIKKIGISVVVKETDSTGLELAFISVFPVESNLIKSYI